MANGEKKWQVPLALAAGLVSAVSSTFFIVSGIYASKTSEITERLIKIESALERRVEYTNEQARLQILRDAAQDAVIALAASGITANAKSLEDIKKALEDTGNDVKTLLRGDTQ